MQVLTFILNLVLFLVSLGVLITIHELGHFMTAKLFKVYCIEFSIGFGPKFFKRKKKGGETTFSIGSIPLGGYVLMYGEGTELPDGVVIGEERSLEGVKKWKRAIILSAGIVLNMVLGMTLFFVSNTALPYYYFQGESVIAEASPAYEAGIRTGDRLGYVNFIHGDNQTLIIDSSVNFNESTYVLGFLPNKVRDNPKLEDGVKLYLPFADGEAASAAGVDDSYIALLDEGKIANIPDFTKVYTANDFVIDDSFVANISTYELNDDGEAINQTFHDLTFTIVSPGLNEPLAFASLGMSFTFTRQWRSFGDALKATWQDFAYANTAVVRGIGMLFTGSGEVSGIVGIFSTSSTILADFGFASYLYLWGLISVNLAIFNLLPFPGLDGWQLLVTAIEAITRKKVPTKVKAIISAVGLVLLFGLMIFITIKDIVHLF
ncbi:MAG: site-2 protease family protein [Bacilli bacterium]